MSAFMVLNIIFSHGPYHGVEGWPVVWALALFIPCLGGV